MTPVMLEYAPHSAFGIGVYFYFFGGKGDFHCKTNTQLNHAQFSHTHILSLSIALTLSLSLRSLSVYCRIAPSNRLCSTAFALYTYIYLRYTYSPYDIIRNM